MGKTPTIKLGYLALTIQQIKHYLNINVALPVTNEKTIYRMYVIRYFSDISIHVYTVRYPTLLWRMSSCICCTLSDTLVTYEFMCTLYVFRSFRDVRVHVYDVRYPTIYWRENSCIRFTLSDTLVTFEVMYSLYVIWDFDDVWVYIQYTLYVIRYIINVWIRLLIRLHLIGISRLDVLAHNFTLILMI